VNSLDWLALGVVVGTWNSWYSLDHARILALLAVALRVAGHIWFPTPHL
jgi:hypothetical protein